MLLLGRDSATVVADLSFPALEYAENHKRTKCDMKIQPHHPGAPACVSLRMSRASTHLPMYSDARPGRFTRKWLVWLVLVVLAFMLCLLRWGGYLLVSTDTLPSHTDAAVALQGSISAQILRIDGAVRLLQQGLTERVLLSVPRQSYWGESIPPVARRYLHTKYGENVADRVYFCEVGPEVNSTEHEAKAVSACIKQHRWRAIVLVTSNYHTRRAGYLWREALKAENPQVSVWVYGVPDPTFEPAGWWRERLYAKTWVLEVAKLVETCLFG